MRGTRARTYHHGDLRRALIRAARSILEKEGIEALSIRAAARKAGVSPGAPYKHFTEKFELLEAVADQGFGELAAKMRLAYGATRPGSERVIALGTAYSAFALRRPSLYRVMIDATRGRERLPPQGDGQAEVAHLMWRAIAEASPPGTSEEEIRLAGIAAWSALHGIVDLYTFRTVEGIRKRMGGEQPFLRAILGHLGVFAGGR
jgi:AcrR family transcriptional regulator